MQKNNELLSSLKDVGLVVVSQLIYHTGNFTCFASWCGFSSYFGTAHSSIVQEPVSISKNNVII
ncbi:hypothetical protein [uncultured Olleya sp.]|uniref:hypothetical protein n=1 Tax=uncultured Olleya sp. TaxID=757243 RepID=UPI002592F39B|nr:hypothetical protein [uncultured Olleya sp.]